MIELVFVACLAHDPMVCTEQKLLYADVPLMACLIGGQSELAAWTSLHSAWTIGRWSCRSHDPSVAEL
jgi:hypothetical protein